MLTHTRSQYNKTPHIGCSVHINNRKIENIQSIDIAQTYGQPNLLKMRLFGDGIQDAASMYIDGAEKLLGKTAHIVLLNLNNDKDDRQEQLFVITRVQLEQQPLNGGVLLLTGHSPDHLLKGKPHYEAFAETTLKQIAEYMYWPHQSITMSYIDCKPTFNRELAFACCFNQNYYDFLQRYAVELGEWFFFNRDKLVYGQLPSYPLSRLVYGTNCSHIDMSMEMQPPQSNLQDYEASANNPLMQNARADDGNISYLNKEAFKQSTILYRNESSAQPVTMDASNGAMEAMARARSRSTAAQLYTLSGESIDWTLHMGKPAELSFKIKGEERAYMTVRVIEINHHYKAGGEYKNTFTAIPATATVPPLTSYTAPQPHTVLATVTDNADAQGRVKVEFTGWNSNKGSNRQSNWMRVAANYAGQSNKVGTNRGFVFVPEVGEQVYVSFENGNSERPYVSGSAFHGKNGQGGRAQNNIKSIVTRSGHTIEFNDAAEGTHIIIKDPGGNEIYLDTKGKNITITAPETLTINAKNIVMNAGENITSQAGNDITASAGNDMVQSVGNDITQTAAGEILENANSRKEIISGDYNRKAGRINNLANAISLFSEQDDLTLQSGKSIQMNSAEKTNQF
ncbi:phage baseplate assembly protein V [Chitinophagaceae bacterium 26-R-25]|nr:phage baseplate assembly protein V [Chitinophagaceae bacterium 26-R-25]